MCIVIEQKNNGYLLKLLDEESNPEIVFEIENNFKKDEEEAEAETMVRLLRAIKGQLLPQTRKHSKYYVNIEIDKKCLDEE